VADIIQLMSPSALRLCRKPPRD